MECTLRSGHEHFKLGLASPLNNSATESGNVTFICANNEKLVWNGLAYLAALSNMFEARSGEEQHFTLILPNYSHQTVQKLLLYLSCGDVNVSIDEKRDLLELAKALRVSCFQKFFD